MLHAAFALALADDAVDRVERARAAEAEGNWAAAIAWYQEALVRDPQFVAARIGLAQASMALAADEERAGMRAEVVRLLEQAATADPRLFADRAYLQWLARAREAAAPVAGGHEAPPPVPGVAPTPSAGALSPREDKGFGVGLELGIAGVVGAQGSVRLWNLFVPSITVSPVFATLDLSAEVVPFRARWSPAVGGGVVWGYEEQGLDTDERLFDDRGMLAHVDLAMDYQAPSGFHLQFGTNVTPLGDGAVLPLPFVSLGWMFSRR